MDLRWKICRQPRNESEVATTIKNLESMAFLRGRRTLPNVLFMPSWVATGAAIVVVS
jgi:hypothetical protein